MSVACFLGALFFWRLGDEWSAKASRERRRPTTIVRTNAAAHPAAAGRTVRAASTAPLPLLGLSVSNTPAATNATGELRLRYRLSNTTRTVGELVRDDRAILLANALIDSSGPVRLPIPDALRAQGDPGAYVVQASGAIDGLFRARLQGVGASFVSYIPNNACLVRVSPANAAQLAALPGIQAVLPFEPYYKLDAQLLALAVENNPLPPDTTLNVVGYPDGRSEALAALARVGAVVVGEDRSPFGQIFKVQAGADSLAALAGLPSVQSIGIATPRRPANDLSRTRAQVAVDSVATTNYLDLRYNPSNWQRIP